MKNTKVLSLFLLLASTQILTGAYKNPDLSFLLAYETINGLNLRINLDNDDAPASKLIDSMNSCITADITFKKLQSQAQGSMFYKGVPVSASTIAEQNTHLQERINTLNHNIKEFEKGGVTVKEKVKVDNRRSERNKLKQQLADNLAMIQSANDGGVAGVTTLIAKNVLAFEDALESYLKLFGQCYLQDNGSTIVISSVHSKDMPITPKEFAQLMSVLKNAASQFGTQVTVQLALNSAGPATIQNVINYINNMPKTSGWSYGTYFKAAGIATGAAIVAYIGYNLYQNKAWNDTENLVNAKTYVVDAATARYLATYDYVANSPYAQSAAQYSKDTIEQVNAFAAQAAQMLMEQGKSKTQAIKEGIAAVVAQLTELANAGYEYAANSVPGQYAVAGISAAIAATLGAYNYVANSQYGQYLGQMSQSVIDKANQVGQYAAEKAAATGASLAQAKQAGIDAVNDFFNNNQYVQAALNSSLGTKAVNAAGYQSPAQQQAAAQQLAAQQAAAQQLAAQQAAAQEQLAEAEQDLATAQAQLKQSQAKYNGGIYDYNGALKAQVAASQQAVDQAQAAVQQAQAQVAALA